MPRQIDKLTDPKVKSAKPKKSSYRLSDGAGLYVHFRFFWDRRHAGRRSVRIGRAIGVLLFVGGLAAAIVAVIIGQAAS